MTATELLDLRLAECTGKRFCDCDGCADRCDRCEDRVDECRCVFAADPVDAAREGL